MTNDKTAGEPIVRIAKRDGMVWWKKTAIYASAIIAAFIVIDLFVVAVTDMGFFAVIGKLFEGTFGGTGKKLLWCIRDTATLWLIAVALSPAFKMKFWNIGAEGQILTGALMCAVVMIYGAKLSPWILFPLMFLAGISGGAAWGLLPAICKAKLKTNETLFTLMMNYVAIQIVACCTNIWRGTNASMGLINTVTQAGWFPFILGSRFMINIFVAVLVAVGMYFFLHFSKSGYETAVVGESINTAKYAGISVTKVTLRTMLISGGICGLVGVLLVAGRDQSISINTAGGMGFTAIIVCWLAKFNPFVMAPVAFLINFMSRGAAQVASATSNMNGYSGDIIVGIMLFFVLGINFFLNYKLIFRRKQMPGNGGNFNKDRSVNDGNANKTVKANIETQSQSETDTVRVSNVDVRNETNGALEKLSAVDGGLCDREKEND